MEVLLLPSYPLVAALIFVLVFATKSSEALECYVCSWSPIDHNSDVCSTGNFDPLRVQTHECETGCEIVTLKDNNGDLEIFYRNCLNNEPVTYETILQSTKLNERRVYTCDSRLCNAAPASPPRPVAVGAALCASFLLLWVARGFGS